MTEPPPNQHAYFDEYAGKLQDKILSTDPLCSEETLWEAIKLQNDSVTFAVTRHVSVTTEMLTAITENPKMVASIVGVINNPKTPISVIEALWDNPHKDYAIFKHSILYPGSEHVSVRMLWEGLMHEDTYIRDTAAAAFNIRSKDDKLFKEVLVYGLHSNGIKEAHTGLPIHWLAELAGTVGLHLTF